MFLIVTRNFPPDVGGMQALMGGLSDGLLNHGPVKVFTFEHPNSKAYDIKSSMNIERIKGIKLPTLFVMEGGYAIEEIGINTVNTLIGFEEK